MSVRAKFKLSAIVRTETYPGSPPQTQLVFSSQYDPTIPEDRRFQKATPWGEIKMNLDNPAALEQFKVYEDYYIDFTPVPKPE